MTDSKLKEAYLLRELWAASWAASVQRVKLYGSSSGHGADSRKKLQHRVIQYLESDVLPSYKSNVSESAHYDTIDKLVEFGTQTGAGLLTDAGYRYASAQKLLNLALKYQWCLGVVAEPPHCPVDRVIIDKTHLKGKINWTTIRSRDKYQDVIEAIRLEAQKQKMSIARWELVTYGRRPASVGVAT